MSPPASILHSRPRGRLAGYKLLAACCPLPLLRFPPQPLPQGLSLRLANPVLLRIAQLLLHHSVLGMPRAQLAIPLFLSRVRSPAPSRCRTPYSPTGHRTFASIPDLPARQPSAPSVLGGAAAVPGVASCS